MIFLGPRPPKPKGLRSKTVKKTVRTLLRKVEKHQALTDQDFKRHWGKKDIRKALWQHHKKKCCYCERKRDRSREPDVEHFRPKGGVAEASDHQGYWWLAYYWQNYLLACKLCNQAYKKNRFPLVDETQRSYSCRDKIVREQPILINPINEDPELLITYSYLESLNMVKAIGWGIRGEMTVNQLTGINDPEVMEHRGQLLTGLNAIARSMTGAIMANNSELIEIGRREIWEATRPELEYVGFRRYYFRNRQLGKYIYQEQDRT